jgi:ribosomal protein L11 methyltransferase
MPDSWKLSLPCTKQEAEAIAEDRVPLALPDPQPVLMTSEPDPARPDAWRLDAYFETEPDAATVALIRTLAPSAGRVAPQMERLSDADWVTLSQAGLDPIRAGRFFVHTAAHADAVPADAVAFSIEAGQAFGTGQHETTTGCLLMLDRLKAHGARFKDIADIGTGTGLLAFAARAQWATAAVIASDIDPVSIAVTAENAEVNAIPVGRGRGRMELVVAAGLAHPRLRARAPYDLVIANILAGPLIDLAPALASAIVPGGSLILAGLLDHQAEKVANAYRREGMRLAGRIDRGDWPTLRLVKRPRGAIAHKPASRG